MLNKQLLLIKCLTLVPAAHLTVHDGGRLKVGQQVVHHIVVLLVPLDNTVVTRHIGTKSVLHQFL